MKSGPAFFFFFHFPAFFFDVLFIAKALGEKIWRQLTVLIKPLKCGNCEA